MKESILRDKLKEFQLFIMENKYSRGLVHDSKNDEDRKKGEAILKDFFIGMVEGKPITKAIEILEYIKEHKWEKTKFKNGDNEERFGVWQYGENFFNWSDLVIDYLVDSFEDMAENLGGSSLVTKEQNKQPQQLEQPQDDGVCPADSDVSSVCVVSPENGKVQSKQPQQLELPQLTEKESFYFARAIEKGLMKQTENGYKWLPEKAKKVSLMYFVSCIHRDLTKDEIPYRKIERLFGYKRLDSVYQSFFRTNQKQSWKSSIDDLF